jgi:hypothetical protein
MPEISTEISDFLVEVYRAKKYPSISDAGQKDLVSLRDNLDQYKQKITLSIDVIEGKSSFMTTMVIGDESKIKSNLDLNEVKELCTKLSVYVSNTVGKTPLPEGFSPEDVLTSLQNVQKILDPKKISELEDQVLRRMIADVSKFTQRKK